MCLPSSCGLLKILKDFAQPGGIGDQLGQRARRQLILYFENAFEYHLSCQVDIDRVRRSRRSWKVRLSTANALNQAGEPVTEFEGKRHELFDFFRRESRVFVTTRNQDRRDIRKSVDGNGLKRVDASDSQGQGQDDHEDTLAEGHLQRR